MKKNVLGLLISLLLYPQIVLGQDVKQLTEAINQLEKIITKKIDKESSTRTMEIKKIQSQVEAIKDQPLQTNDSNSVTIEELNSIKIKLDSLIIFVQNLNNKAVNKINELDPLTKDLSSLIEKLTVLFSQTENNPTVVEEKKKEYGVKLTGTLYTNYNWNYVGIGKEKDANQFEVERLYLTVKGDLSEDFSMRATVDVYSSKADANLNSAYILKYGYLDWKAASWFTLRAGMIPTEWVGYVEDTWKYRGVAKILSDVEGLQSSADVGLSAQIKLPSNIGEAVVMVLNGNGYRKAENNRFKDVAGRITFTPLSNQESVFNKLQLSGHFYNGRYGLGLNRERWGVMISLPFDDFSLAADYESYQDSTLKGTGLSVFGELKLKSIVGIENFSIIGRVDSFDPNTNLDDDKRLRLIYGLVYKASSNVTLVLNNQSLIAEKEVYKKYDGSSSKSDGKIYLNLILVY
jgi:hypothetical protein